MYDEEWLWLPFGERLFRISRSEDEFDLTDI